MPTDPETGLVEPEITINGRALSFAEAMTVRVAVSSFVIWLTDPDNRAGLGERLAVAYTHHAASVEQAMTQRQVAGHVLAELLRSGTPPKCPTCGSGPERWRVVGYDVVWRDGRVVCACGTFIRNYDAD